MYQAMLTLFDRGAPGRLADPSARSCAATISSSSVGVRRPSRCSWKKPRSPDLCSYNGDRTRHGVLRELIQTSAHIIGRLLTQRGRPDAGRDAEKRSSAWPSAGWKAARCPSARSQEHLRVHRAPLRAEEHVTGVATGFEKLDLETSGFQPSDFIIIAGRPSNGQGAALDARVKTATGWKAMGELRLGDALASVDGRSRSFGASSPRGAAGVSRHVLDGRSTECCAEHLWRVHHRRGPSRGC